MNRFDEIRAANPELGFGVYALTPAGAVTLEVYAPDGQTFPFTGETEEAALAKAFPPAPPAIAELEPEIDIFA